MLHNLMVLIQEYLLLSDGGKQRGALKSLELIGSTVQLRENYVRTTGSAFGLRTCRVSVDTRAPRKSLKFA